MSKKLSRNQYREICQRAWDGEKQTEIAKDYGITQAVVSAIKNGGRGEGFTADIRKNYQSPDKLTRRIERTYRDNY